jgi:hypothetical protein
MIFSHIEVRIVQRFIHHIPALNAPFVAPYNRLDVIAHAGQQRLAREQIPLVVVKYPGGDLIMPNQVVANDKHLVFLAEGNVLVRNSKVVLVGVRMNVLPLKAILRRDGIELRRKDCIAARILSGDLSRIDRRADHEVAAIRVFERRGSLSRGREAERQKSSQRCRSYVHEKGLQQKIYFCADEVAGGPKFKRRPASSSEMFLLILREMG